MKIESEDQANAFLDAGMRVLDGAEVGACVDRVAHVRALRWAIGVLRDHPGWWRGMARYDHVALLRKARGMWDGVEKLPPDSGQAPLRPDVTTWRKEWDGSGPRSLFAREDQPNHVVDSARRLRVPHAANGVARKATEGGGNPWVAATGLMGMPGLPSSLLGRRQ